MTEKSFVAERTYAYWCGYNSASLRSLLAAVESKEKWRIEDAMRHARESIGQYDSAMKEGLR